MKQRLNLLFLLLSFGTIAQNPVSDTEKAALKTAFRQWCELALNDPMQYYVTESECDPEYIGEHGYPKDPMREEYVPMRIPGEELVTFTYADVDGDGTTDQLAVFNPIQCDGGNGYQFVQEAVLTSTRKGELFNWSTNDGLFGVIPQKDKMILWIDGIGPGCIYVHYFSDERYEEPQPDVKAVFAYESPGAIGKQVK